MYGELFIFFTRGDEIEERTYTYIHDKRTKYSVIIIVLLSGCQKLALLYVLLLGVLFCAYRQKKQRHRPAKKKTSPPKADASTHRRIT